MLVSRRAIVAVVAILFCIVGLGAGLIIRRGGGSDSELYGSLYFRAANMKTSPQESEALLSRIATESKSNYRTLAKVRLASNKVAGGDRAGAESLYKEIISDRKADKFFVDFSRFMLAMLYAEHGDTAKVEELARESGSNSFKPYFSEAHVVALLAKGDEETAKTEMKAILEDGETPTDVRHRLAELNGYMS
jgi:hypothetical protein